MGWRWCATVQKRFTATRSLLKKITDLIDSTIREVCHYEALYEYPDDDYIKHHWGRRMTYWSIIQSVLMTGLKEAKQNIHNVEAYKDKAINTYDVAKRFANTLKFDMIKSTEWNAFMHPLQDFINEQYDSDYKSYLSLSKLR